MKGSVIIAATLLATGTGWVPIAFAQSERWMKPDQPLPLPAVTESGIHNEADERASSEQARKTSEVFRREGGPAAKGTEENRDTINASDRSRQSSTAH